MATITTSALAQVFSYPSQSLMVRSYTGNIFVIVRTATGYQEYVSTNNGASWSLYTTITRANIVEISDYFFDSDGYGHLAYRVYESGQDRLYYRRAEDFASWSPEIELSRQTAGVSGAIYQGLSLVAVVKGGTTYVHIAAGTTSGSKIGVTMFSVSVKWINDWYWNYGGYYQYNVSNNLVQGTRAWFMNGSGRVTPSVDLRHNGNGYTSRVPDIWLTFGRDQIQCVRIGYANGCWVGPPVATTVATPTSSQDCCPGRYDGNRFIMPVLKNNTVVVYERDPSNTSSDIRTSPVHPQGVVKWVAINYESVSGDFRLYAVGTSNNVLYYIDYARQSASWGSWVSTTQTIVNANNFGARRSSYGNSRFDFYSQTGSSPYTLANTVQVQVFPPNTPIVLTPLNGAAYDVAGTLDFNWSFTDQDTSDTQNAYALSRQIGAGALAYWRASDSTWQASEVQNTSSTTAVSLPVNWGADADNNHTYRVKVWDSTGFSSAYSSGITVVPSAKVNPVITFPTNAETANANDTFTRTVSDLVGSNADTGQTWQGGTGKWNTNGTKAVWVAGAVDYMYLSQGTTGDAKAVIEGCTLNTTAGGSNKTFFLVAKGDSGFVNMVNMTITVDTSGNNIVGLYKKIGGTTTLLAQAVNQLPATSSYTFDASLRVEGEVVIATVGPLTLFGNITTANAGSLASNLFNGFGSNSAANIERFYVNKIVPQTITSSDVTVTWTSTNQKSFRIQLSEANTGILVYDTGNVTSVTSSYSIPYVLKDNTAYRIDLSTTNLEGLASSVQTITFNVDFVEPAVPTMTVIPLPVDGLIRVSLINPDPVNLEPAARKNTVYRRRDVDTGNGDALVSQPASQSINRMFPFNYSFESALGIGWQSDNVGRSTIARTTSQAKLGLASCEQTAVNGSGFAGVYRSPVTTFPVQAGTNFTISFWFKATAGRAIQGRMSWRKANQTDNGNSPDFTLVANGNWQQLVGSAVAPADTGYVVPIIGYSPSANVAGEKCWIDDVQLIVTGDTPTPVVFDDFTAASDIEYQYRVLVTAENGTTVYTPWMA
jgi:hypothetical protein